MLPFEGKGKPPGSDRDLGGSPASELAVLRAVRLLGATAAVHFVGGFVFADA